MTDHDFDRLVAGVLVQAVADAGCSNPVIAQEARQWLQVAAPDLAEQLERHGWRSPRRRRLNHSHLVNLVAA